MMALRLFRVSALLIAASSACASAGPQDLNPGSGDYRAVPLPNETYAVPQDVFASRLRSFPEGREGRQELALSVRKQADGSYEVLLTATGLLDDSVGAEERRAVLRYENGRWRVTQLGERWRCQRDRGPSGWGTRLCN
jgi:hypothetical protein